MWPTRLLGATDFSETGDAAVRVAAAIARSTGAALHLIHALPPGVGISFGPGVGPSTRTGPSDLWTLAGERLGSLACDLGHPSAALHVEAGDPATELLSTQRLLNIDLLVLGARGLRGVRRFVLGSVADRVLRCARESLLLVNEAPVSGEFQRVLVGIDRPGVLSEPLRAAVRLARALGTDLVAVHVLTAENGPVESSPAAADPMRAAHRIEQSVSVLDSEVHPRVELRRGDPVDVLPSFARHPRNDLLVVGAERDGSGRLGRIADAVARAGLPAVMLVRPPEESDDD